MAAEVAQYFRSLADSGQTFSYLAASPLIRAQETAAPIAAALALPIKTTGLLLEAGNRFEGGPSTAATFLKLKNLKLIYNPLRPSWGESYADQVQRMSEAIDQARRDVVAAGGSSAHGILVSHQLPIWVSRLHYSGRRLFHDPRRRECGLASVTTLRFTGDEVTGVSYDDPAASVTSPQ